MRLSFNLAPDVSDLQNKLTALKNQGVAKFDKVFTGIDSLTQNDDCITLNCSPALFPFDKKSLYYLVEKKWLLKHLFQLS